MQLPKTREAQTAKAVGYLYVKEGARGGGLRVVAAGGQVGCQELN